MGDGRSGQLNEWIDRKAVVDVYDPEKACNDTTLFVDPHDP
jgi:hypothetical protein